MRNSKSELEQLLEKNAYGEGLTEEERNRAVELIADPVFSKKDCWVCKGLCSNNTPKAIFDTGICQDHASYALATKK